MSVNDSKSTVYSSKAETPSKKKISSNANEAKERRNQDYLLIWLERNIDLNNSTSQNMLEELVSIGMDVQTFEEPDDCIDFITEIDDIKVLLIIVGTINQHLMPLIHDIPHLESIYVFQDKDTQYKQWPKVQGVFKEIKSLCNSLRDNIYQRDHDAIPMSFLSKQMISTTTTASNENNLDRLEPSFMYTMIFKEILLEITEDTKKAMEKLVEYCSQKGVREYQLLEFQRDYNEKSPVWWYTRPIFLYDMLNLSLRSLDTQAMIALGFFIRDLHRQLQQLYENQRSTFVNRFIVYRGQGLSNKNLQHLRGIKGGLLAFNNFLSTSTEQKIAMKFVERTMHKNKDIVGVLFMMTIDLNKIPTTTTPFALIDGYSAIKTEKEILFSMHTIFRVDDIRQSLSNCHLWEVQLTLTDKNDPQLATLTQFMQKDLRGSTGWHQLADLMLNVGHFTQAEQLYSELLKNAYSDSDRAGIYHQLGWVKDDQGQCTEAVSFYKKSLEIKQKILPKDHPTLAPTYSNIGRLYDNMGDYSKALHFYEKARKIYEKSLSPDHLDLAICFGKIGLVYNNIGDYSKALQFHEKAHKILEKALPPNHPSLATSYNNIGGVYNDMGDYSKALEFYEKAHKIYEKALPPNHPDLAISYSNIGQLYNNMGDYSKA
ncbi:unnamed protein product, partial [Rotaria sp. Silwood1]